MVFDPSTMFSVRRGREDPAVPRDKLDPDYGRGEPEAKQDEESRLLVRDSR